jgi:hypothetical protein
MVEYLSVDEKFLAEMDLKRIPNKDVGLFQACSENVVVFAELMLGIRLYGWQVKFLSEIQDAIDNDNQLQQEFVANTSRQIGKSTAVAVLSIWATVFNKYPVTI